MRNYADEVNLHARIHAMRGRLLSLRDYASMIRETQPSALKSLDAHDLAGVRERLFREQITPIIRLVEAYDQYAPIFLAYLRQFEIQNAKVLLTQSAGLESLQLWYDIEPFAILQKNLLQNRLSAREIKSRVTHTYLEDALQDISSYLRMEINLDITAAKILYQSSSLLDGQTRTDFQNIIFRRLAVLTVIWSYRLRANYHADNEDIRLYVEKFYNLFGGQAISQVRLMEETLNRHVEKLRKSGAQEPSPTDVERHLEQNYYTWLSFMFHKDFHSICSVVTYLWMLFYQIKNLLRVIDGWRFGLSAEAILERLICTERD